MEETILMAHGDRMTDISRKDWEAGITAITGHVAAGLAFMTDDHHRVRNFVVRELPRVASPLTPEFIAGSLTPAPRPGQRHPGGAGKAHDLPVSERSRGRCLGLSGDGRSHAAPGPIRYRREHLRRLSDRCDRDALRARALTGGTPFRYNRIILRALRRTSGYEDGQRTSIRDPGRRAGANALSSLCGLWGPCRAEYHQRLLTQVPVLLFRRTCQDLPRGPSSPGRQLLHPGAGGLFRPDRPVRPLRIPIGSILMPKDKVDHLVKN